MFYKKNIGGINVLHLHTVMSNTNKSLISDMRYFEKIEGVVGHDRVRKGN